MKFEYKGKTVDFLPPIKRYVNSIEFKLNLPFKIKARVMSDFATSICARHEEGESYEDIMLSLGTPAQVAAELNEQMSEYAYRKSKVRFLMIPLALPLVMYVCNCISRLLNSCGSDSASIGIIGGADGPTAVYVTSEFYIISSHIYLFGTIIGSILLVACIFGYWRLSRCKIKPKK